MAVITDKRMIIERLDHVELRYEDREIGKGCRRGETRMARCVTVTPIWRGVDRPIGFGISCADDAKLAMRLKAAIEAGAAFKNIEVRVDVAGKTFMCEEMAVMGRYLNGDLRKLGY